MTSEPAPAFSAHDHARCRAASLARAEELARERGLRLTPVRRRTLEILLEAHRALGAYDVLDRLAEDGFARQPPVAYRALDFLVDHGLAHRVRRLNAFTACMYPGKAHVPIFLICDSCGAVAEAPGADVASALEQAAAGMDFRVDRMNVEAVGLCPICREAGL
ncbi:Zinc uptake regulation protein ZUR [Rhodovulum sp. P5]|uniref:Fur family transcriptional regulator n=1 Tax=Rhodovulum sp. P5 TaxID=1564506 RepID=UPI0009C2D28E|nr:transcriptional repressor [Rhodovulum sp. P5]ARE40179.1 Zinc uptake regulation protein ZUR [Rhodovulum sp. P5]